MKTMKTLLAWTAILVLPASASAALFSDDFDADHTANWTVNKSIGANANDANSSAEFFFDYSTVGIPSAPNSSGGTTLGLRMRANMAGGIFSGLSTSPTGKSFTGNYKVEFDSWFNYNGLAAPGNGIGGGGVTVPGGSGTTQAGNFGIGTSGTTSEWAGTAAIRSVFFATTMDGGSAQDYRAYTSAGHLAPASGVYAAGTGTAPDARNDTAAYYQTAAPGDKAAPAAQVTLFPNQFGTTRTGAAGFAWRHMVIDKTGNIVTWLMDGLLLATVDISTATLGGDNILFGHFDTNATSSTDPNAPSMLFTLIDNVNVTPEPTTLTLLLLAGLGFAHRRRRAC